tara:strand:+ start:470 stop:610 length:141 start_codon:yes stop_codon:yes gene_type:complete
LEEGVLVIEHPEESVARARKRVMNFFIRLAIYVKRFGKQAVYFFIS